MTEGRRTPGLRSLLAALALATVAVLAAVPHAAAQQLTGLAAGPEGEPLARTPVILHRVGGSGGAFVATDTTDSDGAFRFPLEPAAGVYFAALRFQGRLYIGRAVEADGESVTGYMIRVDPANEAGAVASALSGQAPGARAAPPPGRARGAPASADTGAFLLVGLLALAAVLGFLYAAPRYRRHRTRDALVELAGVESALERAGPHEERAALRDTRDRLRKQLAPRG